MCDNNNFFSINSLSLFVILLMFYSCQPSKDIPVIKDIDIAINIVRFEDIIMHIDTNNIEGSISQLYNKYPSFSKLYFSNILPYYKNKSNINENIKNYITDSTTIALYKVVKKKYSDINRLEEEFRLAFKYYKYYFPNFVVPDIYTYISSYGYQRFLFSIDDHKDGIGIGLDMFLKSEIPYKSYFPKEPQFSDYHTRTFDYNHIVQKSIQLLIEDNYGVFRKKTMLDEMIYQGKVTYIMDKILPFHNDSIIINYTINQLNWCENNEFELWSFFKSNDLLYETNPKKIAQYLNPAPYSPGIDAAAPGRTGVYTGWKIVSSYMAQFPDTELSDLLKNKTSLEILKYSKYKPRRKK